MKKATKKRKTILESLIATALELVNRKPKSHVAHECDSLIARWREDYRISFLDDFVRKKKKE